MKNVTKMNENIHRLTMAYRDIFTTVYTVRTESGVLLFDAASYDCDVEQAILPMLESLAITAEELKYIFISHDHPDHSGALQPLIERYPNSCILSRSAALKERYARFSVHCPQDGENILDVLKVVTIPGHTEDSSGILDTRTNTLISGDSLQLYGIYGSGDWGANIGLTSEHLDAVEKLRGMGIDEILTAHDYHPFGYHYCGRKAVGDALNACIEPLLKIKEMVLQNPAMDDAEIRQHYNASTGLPAIGVRVVTGVRAAMKQGRL